MYHELSICKSKYSKTRFFELTCLVYFNIQSSSSGLNNIIASEVAKNHYLFQKYN